MKIKYKLLESDPKSKHAKVTTRVEVSVGLLTTMFMIALASIVLVWYYK